MATEAELIAAIAEANEATNNIAADIDRLINAEPNISDATMSALRSHVDTLRSVASVVPEPEAPPVEPPAEPTP